MATKSIFKSVVIRDDKGAKAFLDAIENSRRAQKKTKTPKVRVQEMTSEEMQSVFGKKK